MRERFKRAGEYDEGLKGFLGRLVLKFRIVHQFVENEGVDIVKNWEGFFFC